MTLTIERLVAAIRDPGATLTDLRRLVGPHPDDAAIHQRLIEQADRAWERSQRECWGPDPELWPWPHGESYRRLQEQIHSFESQYC